MIEKIVITFKDGTEGWIDGICNDCGSAVIEKLSTKDGTDYMNSCSNNKCFNFKWTYVCDMEPASYYEHMSFDNTLVPDIEND